MSFCSYIKFPFESSTYPVPFGVETDSYSYRLLFPNLSEIVFADKVVELISSEKALFCVCFSFIALIL